MKKVERFRNASGAEGVLMQEKDCNTPEGIRARVGGSRNFLNCLQICIFIRTV